MSWRQYARKPKPRKENWKDLRYNPRIAKVSKGGYGTELISSKYGNELIYQKRVARYGQDWPGKTQRDIDYANNFVEGAKQHVLNTADPELPKWLQRHVRSYKFRKDWHAQRAAEHENRLQMRNEEDRKRRYDEEKAKKDYLDVKYAEYMPKWLKMSPTARRWVKQDGNEDRYKWPSGPQQDYHVRSTRAYRNKLAAEKLQRENKRKRNAAESLEEARRYIQQRVAVPKDLNDNIIDLT
jgi:hypothetical protein